MSSVKKIIDWYVKKGVASNPITYQTGRIKRMRTRRGIKNIRITRKKCKKIRYILHRPITRWNKH